MTLKARSVLSDCKHALDLLQEESQPDTFRVLWVAGIALARSVGHVLQKVDGEQDDAMKVAVASAYASWKADKPGNAIFWEFIEEEIDRLHRATRDTLQEWTERLREEAGEAFPEKVTAFRDGMAVHGRFSEPCPDCGAPVQRIVYAENESNYCAGCQTGGKLLKDRALSRLLGADWPRTLDELER